MHEEAALLRGLWSSLTRRSLSATAVSGRPSPQAIACYNAALRVYTEEAFPTYWAGTMHNLSLAHREQGDHHRAVTVLSSVAQSQPENARAIYLLARELALDGQSDDALARLAQAIELDGRHRKMAAEDDAFLSLRGDPRFRELVGEA